MPALAALTTRAFVQISIAQVHDAQQHHDHDGNQQRHFHRRDAAIIAQRAAEILAKALQPQTAHSAGIPLTAPLLISGSVEVAQLPVLPKLDAPDNVTVSAINCVAQEPLPPEKFKYCDGM